MGVRRIVVLAGSARRESLNKRLARVAAARVSALGGQGVFLDPADYRLPLYDGDYETANGVPDPARALGEQVASADGLMIASPEYNGSYPALLKNTIDWLTRIDRRIWVRPTALLSASPGPRGGGRGLQVLRLVGHMHVPLPTGNSVCPPPARRWPAMRCATPARRRNWIGSYPIC